VLSAAPWFIALVFSGHRPLVRDQRHQPPIAPRSALAMPRLILPSVQINIRAGHLPAPEDNGIVYLKIPLNAV